MIPSAVASLRFPVQQSRGRRYPELPHPYRNAFRRDRDRIIHAKSFRRLENKTQVFTSGLSDHFRNRLTHTIEVAQVARTVAAALELDEDLTEALALAHDIGHPPFAHAGEDELNRKMQRFGDEFNHNLHALRLVEKFEQGYARFPGLNLTFEVREGIVKHSQDFEPGEIPGLDEYLPGYRPPLEAQLIDLADEIAYNSSDLDDGFAANLFAIEEVRSVCPGFDELYDNAQYQFPGAGEPMIFIESLRGLVDSLVSGLIDGTCQAVQDSGVACMEDVRRYPSRLSRMTESTQGTNAALKAFLHDCVYSTPELMAARSRSAAMIGELFELFVTHPDRLPRNYTEEAESVPVHRVVCDYIAGMTDRYFERVYRQCVSGGNAGPQ